MTAAAVVPEEEVALENGETVAAALPGEGAALPERLFPHTHPDKLAGEDCATSRGDAAGYSASPRRTPALVTVAVVDEAAARASNRANSEATASAAGGAERVNASGGTTTRPEQALLVEGTAPPLVEGTAADAADSMMPTLPVLALHSTSTHSCGLGIGLVRSARPFSRPAGDVVQLQAQMQPPHLVLVRSVRSRAAERGLVAGRPNAAGGIHLAQLSPFANGGWDATDAPVAEEIPGSARGATPVNRLHSTSANVLDEIIDSNLEGPIDGGVRSPSLGGQRPSPRSSHERGTALRAPPTLPLNDGVTYYCMASPPRPEGPGDALLCGMFEDLLLEATPRKVGAVEPATGAGATASTYNVNFAGSVIDERAIHAVQAAVDATTHCAQPSGWSRAPGPPGKALAVARTLHPRIAGYPRSPGGGEQVVGHDEEAIDAREADRRGAARREANGLQRTVNAAGVDVESPLELPSALTRRPCSDAVGVASPCGETRGSRNELELELSQHPAASAAEGASGPVRGAAAKTLWRSSAADSTADSQVPSPSGESEAAWHARVAAVEFSSPTLAAHPDELPSRLARPAEAWAASPPLGFGAPPSAPFLARPASPGAANLYVEAIGLGEAHRVGPTRSFSRGMTQEAATLRREADAAADPRLPGRVSYASRDVWLRRSHTVRPFGPALGAAHAAPTASDVASPLPLPRRTSLIRQWLAGEVMEHARKSDGPLPQPASTVPLPLLRTGGPPPAWAAAARGPLSRRRPPGGTGALSWIEQLRDDREPGTEVDAEAMPRSDPVGDWWAAQKRPPQQPQQLQMLRLEHGSVPIPPRYMRPTLSRLRLLGPQQPGRPQLHRSLSGPDLLRAQPALSTARTGGGRKTGRWNPRPQDWGDTLREGDLEDELGEAVSEACERISLG